MVYAGQMKIVCLLLQAERDGLLYKRLGQFWKILKTLVQLILNSTWPHVITYTYHLPLLHIKRRTKLICLDNTWEK